MATSTSRRPSRSTLRAYHRPPNRGYVNRRHDPRRSHRCRPAPRRLPVEEHDHRGAPPQPSGSSTRKRLGPPKSGSARWASSPRSGPDGLAAEFHRRSGRRRRCRRRGSCRRGRRHRGRDLHAASRQLHQLVPMTRGLATGAGVLAGSVGIGVVGAGVAAFSPKTTARRLRRALRRRGPAPAGGRRGPRRRSSVSGAPPQSKALPPAASP